MGFFEWAQTAWMCHDQNATVCALGRSVRPGQTAATGAMARSLNRRGGAAVTSFAAPSTRAKKALS
jgi:hypothetical protein